MDLRKVLWMAIALGVLAARGEDLTTLQNVTYTNIKVRRHDPQGILVQHEGGETKIPFADILPELREYYKRMASDLTPAKEAAAPEPPPEPNDLAVRGGRIYRNIVIRKIETYAVHFDHDGGTAKVYFTDVPDQAARDRVRTATPVPRGGRSNIGSSRVWPARILTSSGFRLAAPTRTLSSPARGTGSSISTSFSTSGGP